MTYQAKAPKKTYFAAGYKAGFEAACEAFWVSCSRCGNEEMAQNPSQCTDEDIDGAWEDYCDFWRAKAMNEERA